uniref:ATP synthase complex subunit 8 n=1 Tax=Sclerophasma paresisense TaxID=253126 RepID=Q2Q1J2_9NEOP|nr:ATP synthase F0 subunit 8 [Sclerophasma paresisense]ABB81894.1 ATP synthase F0 subunit 8 [Sclerophasma paresisense]
MPQAAPLYWLILFLFFILSLLMFNTINYFTMNSNSPLSCATKSIKKTLFNWKW